MIESEQELIHRAVDNELDSDEVPVYEALLAGNEEARIFDQKLRALLEKLTKEPAAEAPFDIADAVKKQLPGSGSANVVQKSRTPLFALAASILVAVGLIGFNLDPVQDQDVVGTLAPQKKQLAELVYMKNEYELAIKANSPFVLKVEGDVRALKMHSSLGVAIDATDNGFVLTSDGSAALLVPIVRQNPDEVLTASLELEGETLAGDVLLLPDPE